MRWYKDLYLSESMKGKKLYYQFMIKYHTRLTGTYCLLPSSDSRDLIDIYRSELISAGWKKDDRVIIGLAGTKYEAYLLAGKIICDVKARTGGLDLKSYFYS